MPRFDPGHTAGYYDVLAMGEWERWDRSPRMRVQLAIYTHHLQTRVRPGDRVLDAGCGAGRFTHALIEHGADVTALDISPVQLELCRTNAPGASDYVQASITDLSRFDDGTFDVVLALGGAISYCFEEAPQAVTELVRVLRSGGILGVGVMNLYGSLHEFLPSVFAQPRELNERTIATGDLPREVNRGHECHMFRPDELTALLADAGVADVELHAPGWLSGAHQAEFPDEGSPEWDLLIRAELEASRETPAAGSHIIAWARKPD